MKTPWHERMEFARSGLWAPGIEQCLHHKTKGKQQHFPQHQETPDLSSGISVSKNQKHNTKKYLFYLFIYLFV